MSDDENNDRIASLIGGVFKPCECDFEQCTKYPRWHWKPEANPWNIEWQTIQQKRPDITNERPDFLHDLNAMHEAEKILGKLAGDYDCNLWIILKRDWELLDPKAIISSWYATARQKAEAFVMTMEVKDKT